MKIFKILPLLLVLSCAGYILWLPDVALLKTQNPGETAFMRLREKQAQKRGKDLERTQSWISFDHISPYLRHAIVVAEDGSFYQHDGIDFHEIREAMRRNIQSRKLRFGASTITQQLAKNLYLSPSKNPLRKIKEALITKKLERHLSKRRILEIYLNIVEWGPGIYGAEAASQHYFGKHAWELYPHEAAILAAYLPNPKRYSRPRNAQYVEQMAAKILERMRSRGFLPEEEGGA